MAHQRVESIDIFRGAAIVAMVVVNYLAEVRSAPAFIKHAPDIGLTPADVVAPMFIFAIGLTAGGSLRQRVTRRGRGAAYGDAVRRWLGLIGIGAILAAGEALTRPDTHPTGWGVLQSIGIAGLLTLPVLHLRARYRLLLAVALLAVYQAALDVALRDAVMRAGHGGLFGALAWAAMLILATCFADLFLIDGRRWLYALAGIGTLAAGVALSALVPLSKVRVSPSYVLVSLGICALLYGLFYLACDRGRLSVPVLRWWGRNPLLLYLLHLILMAAVVFPEADGWFRGAPLSLALTQLATLVALLSAISFILDRRRTYVVI